MVQKNIIVYHNMSITYSLASVEINIFLICSNKTTMTINAATKAIAHTIAIVSEIAAIMVADEESDSLSLEVSSVDWNSS